MTNFSANGKKGWIVGGILAAIMAASGTASAGTVYTTKSDFTAALNPGAYTQNFNGFSYSDNTLSATLTNGTYTAVATAEDLFDDPQYLIFLDLGSNPYMTSSGGFSGPITLTFTSGNVNAIGGSFFIASGGGDVVNAPITLNFSDGTSQVLNNQDNSSFFGYIGSAPIASLTISPDSSDEFVSLDNLILGSVAVAVPLPAAAWSGLALLGGLGLFSIIKRHRKQIA